MITSCHIKQSQNALEKIMGYLHKVNSHVYLGVICLEVGYGIERTRKMMESLCDDGFVRPLTVEEKKRKHIDVRCDVWVLVGRAEANKATW